MSFNIAFFRYMCKKSDKKRDKNKLFPQTVEEINNIEYGKHKTDNLLDVYRPKNSEGKKLPVIVSVHGGGYVYGNKEVYRFYTASLSERGFAAVNFNYRLAPKNKFPAQLEDINNVFAWILENHEKYGFDTDNIFAVGDSAGANLLALYSCALTNENYKNKFDFKIPSGLCIKALGLNCGMYDTIEEQSGGQMRSFYKDICPNKCTKEELNLFSVIDYLTPNFPPCRILTANNDILKERQPVFIDALDKTGVSYTYKEYGDEEHILHHVFHCDVGTEYADIANDEECDFFKTFMN